MVYIRSESYILYETQNTQGGEIMAKKWLCKKHAEAHRKAYKPTKVLKWLGDNEKIHRQPVWEDIQVCNDESAKDSCFECRVLARVNNACARIGF